MPNGTLPKPLVLQDHEGKEIGRYEKSVAFVVWISQYTQPWNAIPSLDDFGKRLGNVLEDLDFQVVTLSNPKGSHLQNAFIEFFNEHGRYLNSRVLVYFGGHCSAIKTKHGISNVEYLIPSDAPDLKKDPIWFKENALSLHRLDHYLRRLGAKHALTILDGCSRGFSFGPNKYLQSGPITESEFDPSREVILIKSLEKDASKVRGGLIAGLKGAADIWRDGALTGLELGAYLNNGIGGSWGRVQTTYGKLHGYAQKQGTIVFSLSSAKKREKGEVEPSLDSGSLSSRIEKGEKKASMDSSLAGREPIYNWPEEVDTASSTSPINEKTIWGSNLLGFYEDPETLYD